MSARIACILIGRVHKISEKKTNALLHPIDPFVNYFIKTKIKTPRRENGIA